MAVHQRRWMKVTMKEGWQEMVEGEEEVKTVVYEHIDRSTLNLLTVMLCIRDVLGLITVIILL